MAKIIKEVLQSMISRHKKLRSELFKLFNSNIQSVEMRVNVLEPSGNADFRKLTINDNLEIVKIMIEELFIVIDSQVREAENILQVTR
jgi:hypothetical protein